MSTSKYLYMILVLLISLVFLKKLPLKCYILHISFELMILQTTGDMNLILLDIATCIDNFQYMLQRQWHAMTFRHSEGYCAHYILCFLCLLFKLFKQHIDCFFYKFHFTISFRKTSKAFLFNKYVFKTKFDGRPLSATHFNPLRTKY